MAYRKPATKAGEKKQKFELTEEQKQEIREAFDLFDTDGSGASRAACARGRAPRSTDAFLYSPPALFPRHHRRQGAQGGHARAGL
jgi:hypothetical protein